jgi:large conductance mechanosensitive channel
VVISYGTFINTIIDFIIIAFAMFIVIKAMNKFMRAKQPIKKDCPYCYSNIPIKAIRCPECTSELTGG